MIDVPTILRSLPPAFRSEDAARLGISLKVLRRAVRDDLVRRVAVGYFVQIAVWEVSSARDRHLMLAQIASWQRPWAAVSHHSAALWHELPVPSRLPEWVAQTTDRDTGSANPRGLGRLEPGALSHDEVVTLGEVLLTDVTRTVVDCLRTLPLGDAVAIADAAVRRGLTSVPQMVEQRRRERGWPFIRQADIGLWLLDPARESWFESASFVQLWRDGIPLPEHQVTVLDEGRNFVARTDGLWRAEGAVGEADGAGKYLGEFDADGPSALSAARAVLGEKQREERVRRLGLEFARWAPTDSYADRVLSVRTAFARGDVSLFRGHFVSSPLSRHTARDGVPAPSW